MDTASNRALVSIFNFTVEGSSHFGRSNGRPRANISLSHTSSLTGQEPTASPDKLRQRTQCYTCERQLSCGLRWEKIPRTTRDTEDYSVVLVVRRYMVSECFTVRRDNDSTLNSVRP